MNVRELRELLAKYPDDTLVVMSKDGEGNGFSPLEGTTPALYRATSTYAGEVYEIGRPPTMIAEGAARAVVLWPTN
jgi:hypothetical protein